MDKFKQQLIKYLKLFFGFIGKWLSKGWQKFRRFWKNKHIGKIFFTSWTCIFIKFYHLSCNSSKICRHRCTKKKA